MSEELTGEPHPWDILEKYFDASSLQANHARRGRPRRAGMRGPSTTMPHLRQFLDGIHRLGGGRRANSGTAAISWVPKQLLEHAGRVFEEGAGVKQGGILVGTSLPGTPGSTATPALTTGRLSNFKMSRDAEGAFTRRDVYWLTGLPRVGPPHRAREEVRAWYRTVNPRNHRRSPDRPRRFGVGGVGTVHPETALLNHASTHHEWALCQHSRGEARDTTTAFLRCTQPLSPARLRPLEVAMK